MSGFSCPYCGAAAHPAPQPLLDLAAKALGEARRAIEAKAKGRGLREIASALVADERDEAGPDPRRCPYCRRGELAVSTTRHIALDLAVFGLGFVRLYWVAGGGRRLRAVELGQLVLDGRVRELEHDDDDDDDEEHDEEHDEDALTEVHAPPVELGTYRAQVVPGNSRLIDLNASDTTFL